MPFLFLGLQRKSLWTMTKLRLLGLIMLTLLSSLCHFLVLQSNCISWYLLMNHIRTWDIRRCTLHQAQYRRIYGFIFSLGFSWPSELINSLSLVRDFAWRQCAFWRNNGQ